MFWLVDEETQINEVFRYVPKHLTKNIFIFLNAGDLDPQISQ